MPRRSAKDTASKARLCESAPPSEESNTDLKIRWVASPIIGLLNQLVFLSVHIRRSNVIVRVRFNSGGVRVRLSGALGSNINYHLIVLKG